jgi:hypothetical protein
MFRAAQRWYDNLDKITKDASDMGSDYFVLRYEDLIDDPESWLSQICHFLGIPYDTRMTMLTESSENLGDTAGLNQIVKTNKQKYLTAMDSGSLRKVEAISKEMLLAFGYPVDEDTVQTRVPKIKMTYYQFKDALNLVRSKSHEMEDSSIIGAVKFHIRHLIATKF